MLFTKQCFILLLFSTSETIVQHILATTAGPPPSVLNSNQKISNKKILNKTSLKHQNDEVPALSEDIITIDSAVDEIKDEIFVNELLETPQNTSIIVATETDEGPHYETDWNFIDKDTILVTFDLYSLPKSLIDSTIHAKLKGRNAATTTMATMPSSSIKSIYSLQYFAYIIQPYKQNQTIMLGIKKLIVRNSTTLIKHPHFSDILRLTSLNHHEKYSVCICYYQYNISIKTPDLLLCQDIINDYAKYGHLKAAVKHSLVFIGTQYSIIIGLLVVLQSVYSMRKRRITEYISQHLTTTAQTIRSTLSSVSLVRQSFSSLDAAHEQQQHQQNQQAENSLKNQNEKKLDDDMKLKKRCPSTQFNATNHLSAPTNEGALSSDENEPFLKRISSKNHVHFLLGPGEASDDDDESHHNETNETTKSSNSQAAANSTEPYGDQADALLSMAHILDSNKPWSRQSFQSSPV